MNLQEALDWVYRTGLPARCQLHGEEVRLSYVRPRQGAGRFMLETWRNKTKVREELVSERLVTTQWEKIRPAGPTLQVLVEDACRFREDL